MEAFADAYERLRGGETGVLAEDELEPVDELPDADELDETGDAASDALDHAVVLKLNGGLGTSMGMTKAKSLLEVKDGLSFLDIIVRQVLGQREATGARLPLVLMHSFSTRDDSLAALQRHPEIASDVPLGLRAEQGPQAARRRPDARRLARRTRPRMGAARPRRRVRGARHLGDARHAARSRLSLRLRLQRRQPRRRARPADPGVGGPRGDPVPDGGGRPHRGRPQGRAPRAPAATAGSSCARSPRRRTRTSTPSRTSSATASSTRTRCGSTSTRCTRRSSATACSACR